MKPSPSATRIAFAIYLEGPESSPADIARMQHVVHLFHGHGVNATWVIANCQNLQRLCHKGLLGSGDELALVVSPHEATSSKFRGSLRARLSAVQLCTGRDIGLISCEPAVLRPHAAFLCEQNLHGVLSNTLRRGSDGSPTPLPCGLWQLDHSIAIPEKSWFSRLVRGGNILHRLNKLTTVESTVLISVDATAVAHGSKRSLPTLDKLLRYVSHAATRNELTLTTAGEIVARLSSQRVARPQHSILKPLAA